LKTSASNTWTPIGYCGSACCQLSNGNNRGPGSPLTRNKPRPKWSQNAYRVSVYFIVGFVLQWISCSLDPKDLLHWCQFECAICWYDAFHQGEENF